MNKTMIASLFGCALSPTFAAENTIHLNDVVVTANRAEQTQDNVLGDVTVINQEQISRAGQSTLAELLSTQPGIEIESNGGMGATSNIHIRGTSSQSVIVLVDGMRISSATLGTTNFSQLQPNQIERIEILRGPASSLYGSDGIGGVIQIFTKQGKQGLHLSATAGLGSYNTQQASASASGGTQTTRFALSVASVNTDGISSLRTKTGLDADRDAYRNLSVNGNITQILADGHDISALLYSSQGRYNFDGRNSPAHQDLRQESFALKSNNKWFDFWTSHVQIGKSMDTQDSLGNFGTSYLRTTQDQITWQNDIKLPLGTLILAYDRLEDNVKGNVDFSKKTRFNNGYLANYFVDHDAHSFKLGLRKDYNSQFGSHLTGNIGYGYQLNDNWRATASYGTAYRAPTFNDLYYPFTDNSYTDSSGFHPYTYSGNSQLKPETSKNTEASITYDQGHHRVTLTGYHNEIVNLLVCCNGTTTDHPENVGSATINGATLAYEGWVRNLHLRGNLDIQDPRNDDTKKVLSRRAKEHASFWVGQSWGDWEIGTEMLATGKRYNDADNQIKLAGYALINATAKYKISKAWSFNGRINNVLDKTYALSTSATSSDVNAPAYGTPGANMFVSLTYTPDF